MAYESIQLEAFKETFGSNIGLHPSCPLYLFYHSHDQFQSFLVLRWEEKS